MKYHVLMFTGPELDQLWGYVATAGASGEYAGNKKQFMNRHDKIVAQILESDLQQVTRATA